MFSDCYNLANGIWDVFLKCDSLVKVVIPAGIVSIEGETFMGCWKLSIYGGPSSFAEAYAKEHGDERDLNQEVSECCESE